MDNCKKLSLFKTGSCDLPGFTDIQITPNSDNLKTWWTDPGTKYCYRQHGTHYDLDVVVHHPAHGLIPEHWTCGNK